MKKIFLLAVCFVCLVGNLVAQDGLVFNKFQKKGDKDRSKAVVIGLKGGLNMANMVFTDKALSDLDENIVFRPIGGVFVEIPVMGGLSLAPELMIVGRGTDKSYVAREEQEQNITDVITNYSIESFYIDFRIPVIYRFVISDWFNPYIFAAPDAGFLLGGNISLNKMQNGTVLEEESMSVEIGKANMKTFTMGVVAGVGLRFNMDFQRFSLVWKIEAAYNCGFIDTYSSMEKDDSAISGNVNAYNVTGHRYNRGIEALISIGLPLKFSKNNGCSDFGNKFDRRY